MKRYRTQATPVKCPFCQDKVAKPKLIDECPPNEFKGGRCTCGSVYVLDETGSGAGEALVNVLLLSCQGDWDDAFSMNAGQDYDQITLAYNVRSHTRGRKSMDNAYGVPKLLFIKKK